MFGVHWEMPGVGAASHQLATPPERPIDEESFRMHLKDYDVSVRGTPSGGQAAVAAKGIVSPQVLTREMRMRGIYMKGGKA